MSGWLLNSLLDFSKETFYIQKPLVIFFWLKKKILSYKVGVLYSMKVDENHTLEQEIQKTAWQARAAPSVWKHVPILREPKPLTRTHHSSCRALLPGSRQPPSQATAGLSGPAAICWPPVLRAVRNRGASDM